MRCPDRKGSVLARFVVTDQEAVLCKGRHGRAIRLSNLDCVALVAPSQAYQSLTRAPWTSMLALKDHDGKVLKVHVEVVEPRRERLAAALPGGVTIYPAAKEYLATGLPADWLK